MTTTEDVKGTAFQRDTSDYSQDPGRMAAGAKENYSRLMFELLRQSWTMQGLCCALRIVLDDVEHSLEALTRDHFDAIHALSQVMMQMSQHNHTLISDLGKVRYQKS